MAPRYIYLTLLTVLLWWRAKVHGFLANPLPRTSATLWPFKQTSPLFPYVSAFPVIFKKKYEQVATDRVMVDRFSKSTASKNTTESASIEAKEEVIITIHGKLYNLTSWTNSHPGGSAVLKKFRGKDATVAFEKARHSHVAYGMLEHFEVGSVEDATVKTIASIDEEVKLREKVRKSEIFSSGLPSLSTNATEVDRPSLPLWRTKLFTSEDSMGIHKILGVFVLLHFAYRLIWKGLVSSDPSAGLGSRCGRGAALLPIMCVIPHGILSLSSLIFHTVPRERVVGKPMIWQEFRAHNIIFGLRSVVCTVLAWVSYYKHHTTAWRRLAVWGSSTAVLLSNGLADEATRRLRANSFESTTATMPYWEECSDETKRRFKKFYAFSQFMATIACLMAGNPVWPLSVLLAIQLASLLMTLVRKGLISARAYHYAYTASLCVPYIILARHLSYLKNPVCEALFYFVGGTCLFQLRRKGVSKYLLWGPVIAARVIIGDRLLSWDVW